MGCSWRVLVSASLCCSCPVGMRGGSISLMAPNHEDPPNTSALCISPCESEGHRCPATYGSVKSWSCGVLSQCNCSGVFHSCLTIKTDSTPQRWPPLQTQSPQPDTCLCLFCGCQQSVEATESLLHSSTCLRVGLVQPGSEMSSCCFCETPDNPGIPGCASSYHFI